MSHSTKEESSATFDFIMKLATSNKGHLVPDVVKANKGLLKQRDSEGYTPIHRAVCSGAIETAQFFMEEGGLAAVRARFYSQKNKSSIVHYCLARGWNTVHSESVSKLPFSSVVKTAAKVMGERFFALRDINGINPLGLAAVTGQLEAMDYLLRLDAFTQQMAKHEHELIEEG